MMYLMGVLAAVTVLQTWFFCQTVRRIGGLGRIEERLASLTNTVALLTDTTEACFNVVAAQLEPAAPSVKARAARQRRVVGAASRGRSIPEIAAQEEVAESEVALRLALERRPAGGVDPRPVQRRGISRGEMRS